MGNLDDVELKNLLDEAITYKRPKDREHKSKIFKVKTIGWRTKQSVLYKPVFLLLLLFAVPQELLQHAELEDQARNDCFLNCVSSMSRTGKGQGRSLQDLVEAVRMEHLVEAEQAARGGRHHHNSRQKKYSSVSSRQREGGSLPSNVNCKECPYEQSFLSEFNKRKTKLERVHGSRATGVDAADELFVLGTAAQQLKAAETAAKAATAAMAPAKAAQTSASAAAAAAGGSGDHQHTIIQIESDETQHLLAHDSLAQVKWAF